MVTKKGIMVSIVTNKQKKSIQLDLGIKTKPCKLRLMHVIIGNYY